MKNLAKRCLIVLLAVTLLAVFSIPALAAGDNTITIQKTTAGYTYKAYQVFAGEVAEDGGDTILTNIDWGSGVDVSALLTALQGDETVGSSFTDCTTAADVANALDGFSGDNLKIVAELIAANLATVAGTSTYNTTNYTISGLDSGYYFIQSTTVPETGTHTEYMLKVVKSITVTPKDSDIPGVEKKVLEDEKYTQNGGYGAGYNDVADYDIGDTVPFKLIGTIPDMAAYETYAYTFHDTMSAGLTLDESSIQVYLTTAKDATLDTPLTADDNYTVTTSGLGDGCSFEVAFTDLKTVPNIGTNQYVIVTFNATLNENAEIGLDGNPNTVYLTFSNNPYDDSTGKTPDDKAIVFTYELDTTKVDGNNQTPLPNAQFVLFNEQKTDVALIDAAGKVDGWIPLTTIQAEATAETITAEQLLAYSHAEGSIILTSAETTGLFTVTGLDDDVYYLREIAAPALYNLLEDDVKVEIDATTTNGQTWVDFSAASALTALEVKVNDGAGAAGTLATGVVAINVENNKGNTLPETGGIGTTLFYVIGGTLAVSAGILLVIRKRTRFEHHS